MTKSAFFLACAVVIACQSPAGPFDPDRVDVRLSRDSFVQGDTVTVAITNRTGRALAYNFCPVVLERQQQETEVWEPVAEPLPYLEGCTAALWGIGADKTIAIQRSIPANALPGVYRLRVSGLQKGDGRPVSAEWLWSPNFSVRVLSPAT